VAEIALIEDFAVGGEAAMDRPYQDESLGTILGSLGYRCGYT
jgi:hypothetical protein